MRFESELTFDFTISMKNLPLQTPSSSRQSWAMGFPSMHNWTRRPIPGPPAGTVALQPYEDRLKKNKPWLEGDCYDTRPEHAILFTLGITNKG